MCLKRVINKLYLWLTINMIIMKKNYFLLISLFGVLAINAQVGTGFEEPNGALGTQRYLDANLADHELVNNPNQPIVQHTGTTELGFTTTFSNNLGTGLSEGTGDAVGVYEGPINNTEILDIFPAYASSGYIIEDPDGTITVEFDGVDLTGTTSPRFQMSLFLNSTTYESTEFIKIFLKINNGASPDFVILDTTGQDIDAFLYNGASLEEVFTAIDVDISAYIGSITTLVVQAQSNSATEEYMFDDILFTEGVKEGTLSNHEFAINNAFSVYPNPSNGNITIKNSGIALDRIQISDLNGRVVANYDLNGTVEDKELNLESMLSSGMYLMTLSSDNASTVKKIVIN